MNYPKVSIIILNWNGLEDTIECLESLKKISYPNYEVIVVDNGSKGNDAQVLEEKFGDYIHLIKNDKNYGYAEGNNIGIRYALSNSQPDYVLLLNNDTVVDPEFLTEMIKVAETNTAIGIVGPKLYYYDNPNQLQSLWGKIDLRKGQVSEIPKMVAEKFKSVELDKGQYNQIREVDSIKGCCFLIKKRTLEDIGLLDKSYFSFWEETDYCLRATKKNYKTVYVPNAKAWHKGAQSEKKVPGLSRYYMTRNRFKFMKKHATKWQYRCFQIYFFAFYFWIATGYYLIYLHSLNLLISFYRGVKDGLFNSEASAKFYRRD
ncbi:MAG TPA: glycosyltransferase family 2 protein [Dehalococcoidia bacterium]|nr:glycosyltransferase family 2 protein [Dehalococcoidia bacterium]